MRIKLFDVQPDPGGFFASTDKSYTSGRDGSLLYLTRQGVAGTAYRCRESFFYHQPKKREMIAFISSSLNITNLIKWFKETEILLKIPVRKRTKIFKTNYDGVVAIDPARFWWKNRMRESFLTLFIRTFGSYAGEAKTLQSAIKSNQYGRYCFQAIKLFLEGHTVPSSWLKANLHGYGGVLSWCWSLDRALAKTQLLKEVKKKKPDDFNRQSGQE